MIIAENHEAPPQFTIQKINQYNPIEKNENPNKNALIKGDSVFLRIKKRIGKTIKGINNKLKGLKARTSKPPKIIAGKKLMIRVMPLFYNQSDTKLKDFFRPLDIKLLTFNSINILHT